MDVRTSLPQINYLRVSPKRREAWSQNQQLVYDTTGAVKAGARVRSGLGCDFGNTMLDYVKQHIAPYNESLVVDSDSLGVRFTLPPGWMMLEPEDTSLIFPARRMYTSRNAIVHLSQVIPVDTNDIGVSGLDMQDQTIEAYVAERIDETPSNFPESFPSPTWIDLDGKPAYVVYGENHDNMTGVLSLYVQHPSRDNRVIVITMRNTPLLENEPLTQGLVDNLEHIKAVKSLEYY